MSHIIEIMKQTMKKISINSKNVALSFPLLLKMKKLKTFYSSKKIYNTKYIDNRTMQRLHKWLPFLILLFDLHSFHGGTFQPKQFSAVNLYGAHKMVDPSFQYNKKFIARNTLYSLVSAIFLSFL